MTEKRNMFNIFRSKLQSKFTLFFVMLGTVPVLVLGGLALYLVDLSHKRDVSNLELQLIDQKQEEIRKFFADTLGIIELRVAFSQKSEIDPIQQDFLLKGFLQENRAFEEVSFIGLDGKETARLSRDGSKDTLQDVSHLQGFLAAQSGKNYISPVHATLRGPMVTIASAVRNRNDDIIQVISAEVNLLSLVRLIETAHLGSSGYLILLDQQGSLILPRGLDNPDKTVAIARSSRVSRVLNGEILDGLDPHDRYQSMITRVAVIGAGKKISPVGWAILSEWPIDDADAVIRDVRNEVMTFTLLSILAVLLLIPLFVVRLLKPIRELEQGAAEIEKGNFEKQIAIVTHDELQDLGEAFNRMTKGLKRLQELRDEFVFIAAHELRSPVTVVRGYLSMLEEETGKLTEAGKGYVKNIKAANDRLAQLVTDLLEVARSEAGRIVIEVAPIDIRESIRPALEEIEPLAREKSMVIAYDIPDTQKQLPHILADSSRIKEIIINIVGNAIKYSPEKASVTITHEIKDKHLITHIKDTGYGISQEAQQKLFEKFYRVRTKETLNIPGTGLGLFIIKELIGKMNGTLWFVSEEHKGSTFSFSFPLA